MAELLPFRDITKPGVVAKYIREICQAFDENQSCPVCDGAMPINGRADVKKTPRRAYQTCDICLERRGKELAGRRAAERAELERHLGPHIYDMQNKTVSYKGFTDDTIIVLQAISILIGPRLLLGTFCLSDCEQLTPMGARDFIDRLYTEEVLVDDPTDAPNGTYLVEKGKLLIKKSTARYLLPPDTGRGREPEAIRELFDREFSDANALTNLWLDFAVTDVMRYMDNQCSLHNHDLDQEAIQKVEGLVRHGLRTFSVSQMWFIIWKVTRDAAALASRIYYSHEKATATIPTKIHKQLEAAYQGATLRNDWGRPEPHIAGAIGQVFNSQFGMNELTKGAEVLRLFSAISDKRKGEGDLYKLAASFMKETLEGQDSVAALDAFAVLIRSGLSTEDAILEIVNRGA